MHSLKMCFKFFMCLLIGTIRCSYGLSLPLPMDMEGEYMGEVTVDLKEDGERLRRSTDGVSIPAKTIEVTFPFNNGQVDLHLKRMDERSANVPVFATNDRGEIVRQYIQDKSNVFFYQDESKFAAFYVETTDNALCMFGSFEDRSNEYFLEPKEKNCDPKSPGMFKILMAKHTNITFHDRIPIDNTQRRYKVTPPGAPVPEGLVRRKRAVPEYKIETLLVVDFSVYNYWYTQSTKATPGEKDEDAKANIRQYYAWVINGMDVRYKNIQTSTYTISVVFAGIYIADTPSKSTFTENNKDSSAPKPKVVASTVLDDVTSWVNSNTASLPSHDHAMMFSRYDFTSSGSSSNAGLAWVGAVCTTQSVSIVEDHFNFVIMTIAAHELGHSLSAEHDGTGNTCSSSDSFIMASSSSVVDNTNPWKFSTCSTNYFTAYITSLNSGNGNCMTTQSASFDPTALNQYTSLPGQVFDADAMCKHILGPASSFCMFPYNNNYTSICTTLWCRKTDGSGQCESAAGADGLHCGNRKWCVSGVCTYDDCAPSGDESCLYGDRSGEVINFNNAGKTCSQIANEPHLCYHVSDECCQTCGRFYTGRQDCEYGDKVSGCTSGHCPANPDLCCGTCYTGTTTVPVTTTETPNLCKTTTVLTTSTIATSTTEQQTTTTTSQQPTTTVQVTTTLEPTTTATTPTTTTTTPTTTTTEPTTTTTIPTTTTTIPATTTTTPSTTTEPTTTTTTPTTTTSEPTTTTTTPTTTTTIPTRTSTEPITTTTEPTTTTTTPTTTTTEPTTTTTTLKTTTTEPTTTTTTPTTTTTEPATTTTIPTTTTTIPTTTTTISTTTTTTQTTTTEPTTTTTIPTTTTTEPTTTTTPPTTTTTEPTTTTTIPTTTTTIPTTTTTIPTTTTGITTMTTGPTTTTTEPTMTIIIQTTTTTIPTTTTTIPTTTTTFSTTTTEPTTSTTTPTTSTTIPTTNIDPTRTTTFPKTTTNIPTTTTTEPTTTIAEQTTTTTEPTTTATELKTTTTESPTTTAEPTTSNREQTTTILTSTTSEQTTTATEPTTTTSEPTTTTKEPTTTTTEPITTTTEPETTTNIQTTTSKQTTTTSESITATVHNTTTLEPTTTSIEPTTTSIEPTTTIQDPTRTTDSTTSTIKTETTTLKLTTISRDSTTTTTEPTTTTTEPTTTTTEPTTTTTGSTTITTEPTTTTTESATIMTKQTATTTEPTKTTELTTSTEPTSTTTEQTTSTIELTTITKEPTTTIISTVSSPVTTTSATTTTTLPPTTSSTVPVTTTPTVIGTNEIRFIFVIRLVIFITEDLTISAQYSLVMIRAETALTELYQRRLGSRFKRCRVKRVRSGSLIVDYDVIADDEPTSTSDVVSVAKDLVSGTENVTYDGQSAPVSSAAFVDSSGTNVNISSATTGCEVLESSSPCGSGYKCIEGSSGPYCRKSVSEYDTQMLIIIGAIVGSICLLVTTAVILVLCICKNQRKEKGGSQYGIDNPAITPDDFHHNSRLHYENDSDMGSPFYGRRWYPGYNEMAPNGTWHQQPMNYVKYSIPRPKY